MAMAAPRARRRFLRSMSPPSDYAFVLPDLAGRGGRGWSRAAHDGLTDVRLSEPSARGQASCGIPIHRTRDRDAGARDLARAFAHARRIGAGRADIALRRPRGDALRDRRIPEACEREEDRPFWNAVAARLLAIAFDDGLLGRQSLRDEIDGPRHVRRQPV